MTRHLVLLMTAGMSVNAWHKNGSLDRELKLYLDLSKSCKKLTILDYSSKEEFISLPISLKASLSENNIEIYSLYGEKTPRSPISKLFWSFARTISYKEKVTHIKSNQTKGAWLGIILKLLNRNAIFLHRSGYSWSNFTYKINKNIISLFLCNLIEFTINLFANEIHVASEADKNRISKFAITKTKVVPNWVDSVNKHNKSKKNQSLFVGRLEPQKNLLSLLKFWPKNEKLIIVGDGSERTQVDEIIKLKGLSIEVHKKLEHYKVLELMSLSKCLVCWSHFEGHPKVVLETILSGTPVIALDAPGVSEVMKSGRFGILLEDHSSLKSALSDIMTFVGDLPIADKILKKSSYRYTFKENLSFLENQN